jgi:hypothetical protein
VSVLRTGRVGARENGASALIARAGKGGNLDENVAVSSRRQIASDAARRLLPPQRHVDAWRSGSIRREGKGARPGRSWKAAALLLCGDFDAQSRLSDIVRFMDRVEDRTGVVPVAYLENSTHLKRLLGNADPATKAKLRRMPYWVALYSHTSGAGPEFPAPGSPRGLVNQYRVWSDWTMWQYGGVDWERGRSRPKVYSHGAYRFPLYFGNLDRPVERNVFNGSQVRCGASGSGTA